MRILDRYLLAELFQVWVAVLLVLLLITFGTQASELLTEAVQGSVSPTLVGHLLLLKLPPALEVVVPLVMLLAALLTFGRWYQDREMVVLYSCGISPAYLQRRVALFALPVALLVLFNAGWLAPWSEEKSRLMLTEAQRSLGLATLQPGRFNPLGQGGVFYMAERGEDWRMQQVWLRYPTPEGELVLSAPQGGFEWVDGRLALVLQDAWSVQGLDQPETGVTVRHFQRFEGFVPQLSMSLPQRGLKELTLPELFNKDTPQAHALLHQKLIAPVSVLVMALMGLVLSRTGPREGRFARVFWALLLYVLYVQLLTTFQDRIRQGELIWVWGMWAVPLGYLFWLLWPRRRA